MSNTINDSMPPRPDVEFDFNLPHGIDAGDSVKGNLHSTHGYQENDNLPKVMHEHVEQDIDIDMRDRSNDDNSIHDQNSSDQDMNHQILQILEQGFSDDDDAPQAFDRSWSGHQARKSPPTSKKSPRTDGDDAPQAFDASRLPRPGAYRSRLRRSPRCWQELIVVPGWLLCAIPPLLVPRAIMFGELVLVVSNSKNFAHSTDLLKLPDIIHVVPLLPPFVYR